MEFSVEPSENDNVQIVNSQAATENNDTQTQKEQTKAKNRKPKTQKQMEAFKKAQEARQLRLMLKKKKEEKEIDDLLKQLANNKIHNDAEKKKTVKQAPKIEQPEEEEEETEDEPDGQLQDDDEDEQDDYDFRNRPVMYDYVDTIKPAYYFDQPAYNMQSAKRPMKRPVVPQHRQTVYYPEEEYEYEQPSNYPTSRSRLAVPMHVQSSRPVIQQEFKPSIISQPSRLFVDQPALNTGVNIFRY